MTTDNPTPRRQPPYTVAEIDEMRSMVGDLMMRVSGSNSWSCASATEIEERLRTYILVGIPLDVLRIERDAKIANDKKYQEIIRKQKEAEFERRKPEREARAAKAAELKATMWILDCLQVEISESAFRCACCNTMQKAGSGYVHILEGTKKSDPVEVTRQRHMNKGWNYHSSAWCMSCAPREPVTKTPPPPPPEDWPATKPQQPVSRGFLSRLFFGPW